MAFRKMGMLKDLVGNLGFRFSSVRWSHTARFAPVQITMEPTSEPECVLPESQEVFNNAGFQNPDLYNDGMLELMAVPKKKVSKYKRGLRNGPKALKPIPVIIRCRCCGRVKLPHFYCCSGERGVNDKNDSSG